MMNIYNRVKVFPAVYTQHGLQFAKFEVNNVKFHLNDATLFIKI